MKPEPTVVGPGPGPAGGLTVDHGVGDEMEGNETGALCPSLFFAGNMCGMDASFCRSNALAGLEGRA